MSFTFSDKQNKINMRTIQSMLNNRPSNSQSQVLHAKSRAGGYISGNPKNIQPNFITNPRSNS